MRVWLLPALASALMLVVAIAIGWSRWPAPPAAGDQALLEALDVLTDELDPEFYEDLDLYRWLAQPATESPRV